MLSALPAKLRHICGEIWGLFLQCGLKIAGLTTRLDGGHDLASPTILAKGDVYQHDQARQAQTALAATTLRQLTTSSNKLRKNILIVTTLMWLA